MKKLLFLLLIIPLVASAKFYKASITFNDGTTKNGFIELPQYPDDAKIKFRAEEKGKTEKFSSDEVKNFEITNDENKTVKYVTMKLATPGLFNHKNIKVDTKKSWVRILKEGKISLYAGHYAYNAGMKTGGGGIYYVKRQNDDYALYLEEFSGGGLSFNMNGFQNFKKMVTSYFEADCPTLPQSLDKDEINKKGIVYIVDLYDQNCGK